METNTFEQIPTPELEKKVKTSKTVIALFAGMGIVMLISIIILMVLGKNTTTNIISFLALTPLFLLSRNNVKAMEQELARRSSQG